MPIACCLLTVMLALPAFAAVNQQAIDDVAAGKLNEAKASWWGFDAADSTAALQAAINSGVKRLTIDNVGKPWIVEPIHLVSNQEIVLEKGVTVLAKRGAFEGGSDSLFNIIGKQNVTIRGYGATLRMWRDDYAKAPYSKAEWRMTLEMDGVNNVKVYGLTLAESGGDGIYVGAGADGAPCRNVLIKDVTCDRNYRQGISVISAENLLIEDCVLSNTDGTAPRAGIDFEPNGPTERLVNCEMRNCLIQGNGGDGIDIYIPTLNGTSEPVSMRFADCKCSGDRSGALRLYTGNTEADAVMGRIEFVGCTFEGSKAAGISVGDKPVGGLKLRFASCTVANVALENPAESPIMLAASGNARRSVGEIEFADCIVGDPLKRQPLNFLDSTGNIKVEQVTGKLTLEQGETRTELPITSEVLAKWMPFLAFKVIAPVKLAGLTLHPAKPIAASEGNAPPARLREAATYALYAQAGQAVGVTVRYLPVARYAGNTIPVVITAPSGKEAHRADLPFEKETRVSFTAPETGVYSVVCTPGANWVQVIDSTNPVSLSAEPRAVPFYSSTGRFYFWVPKGTREFAIKTVGQDGGESLKATLCDPAGKVVESADNILRASQFTQELPEPSPGGIWSLLIELPSAGIMEDYRVDMFGVPPLLAGSEGAVLVGE